NDTSSVVAAAATFGPVAADHAVVVKLVRTLLIIPIVLWLSLLVARRDRRAAVDAPEGTSTSALRLVPWFLVGFLVLATVNSLGVVPSAWHGPLALAASFIITVALTAIGLSTDLPALRAAGVRPLMLGGLLWLLVTLSALAIMAVTHVL